MCGFITTKSVFYIFYVLLSMLKRRKGMQSPICIIWKSDLLNNCRLQPCPIMRHAFVLNCMYEHEKHYTLKLIIAIRWYNDYAYKKQSHSYNRCVWGFFLSLELDLKCKYSGVCAWIWFSVTYLYFMDSNKG